MTYCLHSLFVVYTKLVHLWLWFCSIILTTTATFFLVYLCIPFQQCPKIALLLLPIVEPHTSIHKIMHHSKYCQCSSAIWVQGFLYSLLVSHFDSSYRWWDGVELELFHLNNLTAKLFTTQTLLCTLISPHRFASLEYIGVDETTNWNEIVGYVPKHLESTFNSICQHFLYKC